MLKVYECKDHHASGCPVSPLDLKVSIALEEPQISVLGWQGAHSPVLGMTINAPEEAGLPSCATFIKRNQVQRRGRIHRGSLKFQVCI